MRAQVTWKEWTLESTVPSQAGFYMAIVGPFKKGLTDKPFLSTSAKAFLDRCTPNGTIKLNYHPSHHSVLAAHEATDKIFIARAANNPLFGGAVATQTVPIESVVGSFMDENFTIHLDVTSSENLEAAKRFWKYADFGEPVMLSGSLPTELDDTTKYYLIPFDKDTYSFQLAESPSDALDEEYIEFTGGSNVTITINTNRDNKSLSYGLYNPAQYVLDTTDGKPAGFSSEFTVDMDKALFLTTDAFYALAETGNAVMVSGTTMPVVKTGDQITDADTLYLIKKTGTAFQLARSLTDANDGLYIDFSDSGDGLAFMLVDKAASSDATFDEATDVFTVDQEFYDTVETGSPVFFTVVGGDYPLVDSGDLLDATTIYYVIKSATNLEVQLSRTANGSAITFSTAGSGTFTFNLDGKDSDASVTADLSSDTLNVEATFWSLAEQHGKVRLSSTGTLPEGLAEDTDYFIDKTISGKVTLSNSALAVTIGRTMDIESEGTGIHTIYGADNELLAGSERYCLLLVGESPGGFNNDLFYTSIHYPYLSKTEEQLRADGWADWDLDAELQRLKDAEWSEQDFEDALTVGEPGCFLIQVYGYDTRGNIFKLEEHVCSRDPEKKNASGQNVFVENVLSTSMYIKGYSNPEVEPYIYPKNQRTILKLHGGSDGGTVTDSEMIKALGQLDNDKAFPISAIMDGGWTTSAYQKQGLVAFAERNYSFAILGMPADLEADADNAILEVVNYKNRTANFNTSFACIFTPHVIIADKFNDGVEKVVGCDGYVASRMARTANQRAVWVPFAGQQRGIINVKDTLRHWTGGEEDYLYKNAINPITFSEGEGIMLWGNKTPYAYTGPLGYITTRLMLNQLRPGVLAFLKGFLFEPAPYEEISYTEQNLISGLTAVMQAYQTGGALYDFKIECGLNVTYTVHDLNNHKIKIRNWVTSSVDIEYIDFINVITPVGATFEL